MHVFGCQLFMRRSFDVPCLAEEGKSADEEVGGVELVPYEAVAGRGGEGVGGLCQPSPMPRIPKSVAREHECSSPPCNHQHLLLGDRHNRIRTCPESNLLGPLAYLWDQNEYGGNNLGPSHLYDFSQRPYYLVWQVLLAVSPKFAGIIHGPIRYSNGHFSEDGMGRTKKKNPTKCGVFLKFGGGGN